MSTEKCKSSGSIFKLVLVFCICNENKSVVNTASAVTAAAAACYRPRATVLSYDMLARPIPLQYCHIKLLRTYEDVRNSC